MAIRPDGWWGGFGKGDQHRLHIKFLRRLLCILILYLFLGLMRDTLLKNCYKTSLSFLYTKYIQYEYARIYSSLMCILIFIKIFIKFCKIVIYSHLKPIFSKVKTPIIIGLQRFANFTFLNNF